MTGAETERGIMWATPLVLDWWMREPWSDWHSTGPQFQNRWYVWVEQTVLQLEGSPWYWLMDSGAMVRLALNWITVPEQMVCMDGTEQCWNFSNPLGFWLMDMGAMVRLALNWTTVPEQMVCMDGTEQCSNFSNPLGFDWWNWEPWSGWHSTGPQFHNRLYVWMEQSSVETCYLRGIDWRTLEPWSGWHSTGPQFQNRWYVWMEQSSVETLAFPLGLTNGIWSHGQTGTQLDHSSRTDGMYGWNRAVLKL